MQAVGIYLKTLREAQDLTAQDVADVAGTNQTYIWRVEAGQLKSPGVELLSKIINAVRGRGDHVIQLLIAENPSEDFARSLAKQAQLTPDQIGQAELFLTTDEDTRALLESILEVSVNKELRARIIGYVNGLKSQPGVAAPAEAPRRTSRRRRKP